LTTQPVIIAYDITSDATRRRVRQVVQEWRLDGQKSVHECLLTQPQAQELFLQLAETLSGTRDRLLLAWVAPHRACMARGKGRTGGPPFGAARVI
jgi:CRISPR-associated protein Cas2